MNTKNIKTKKPWRRVKPIGYLNAGESSDAAQNIQMDESMIFQVVRQSDFLREYYPSGHAINDPTIYPDIYKEEEVPVLDESGNDTGKKSRRVYKEKVPRYAFAFQQIITVKQLVHLCGNDIQFELNTSEPSDSQRESFSIFREGWMGKDMEIAFYEAVKSVKITGDGAVVGYLHKGEFGYKTLSYMNGDVLYPHYDSITGELNVFARSYYDYDDEGEIVCEWLEVWDKTMLRRFKKTGEKYQSIMERIIGMFKLSGYVAVEEKPHGFPFVPVAYMRSEDGACWSPSQNSIEGYEVTFSQMAHNNQAFGEPILYLQGEEIEMVHDLNGSLKILSMGTDDKAGYLESQSASESFMKQLDTLYKMINEQSFAVIPPELRSGDLPAAALKILYSPAYEKATCDAAEFQGFLNSLVQMFSYGYGIETEHSIDFANLPVKWWIKPYIHLNESAIVADLATSVQNGFISKETASERIPFYATVGEWDRVVREFKEQQQQDILAEIQLNKATQPNDTIQVEEA